MLLTSLKLGSLGLPYEGLLVVNALIGLCPVAFGLLGYKARKQDTLGEALSLSRRLRAAPRSNDAVALL